MPRRLDIPPFYLLCSLVLTWLLHRGLPGPQLVHGSWRWLGLVPIAAGVALAIAAVRSFKRAGTAVQPFSEPSVVVTTGPFAFTRNPMYLGTMLLLLGWIILLGSLVPLVVLPAYFALIHCRFVLREEPFMAERLGEPYEAYRRRVRRWL